MNNNEYFLPYGYSGIGLDIKWCGRWSGGKRCLLCHHYAEFEKWTKEWNWYYLIRWADSFRWGCLDYAHHKRNFEYASSYFIKNYNYPNEPYAFRIRPKKYRNRGLKETDLKSLLKNGCKPKRKCKCVSVMQRGNWYCPGCWENINNVAKQRKEHIHDLMISDRSELKGEILLMRLAGIL